MKFMIVTKTSAAHGSGAVSLNNFLENFEPGMIACHFFPGEDIGEISSIQLEARRKAIRWIMRWLCRIPMTSHCVISVIRMKAMSKV